MPRSTGPADDFADLFNDDVPEVVEPAPEPTPPAAKKAAPAKKVEPVAAAEPVETPEQARIRELEEALAAPLPKFEDEDASTIKGEPTPEQLRIKELEDKLARRNATVAENSPAQYDQPAGDGERILIHFLEDGFTALGRVWHRGQELEFVVGSQGYEQTKDRDGNTWVRLASDIPAQMRLWGRQRIGSGPFIPRRGEVFEDDVAVEDRQRNRAVPIIPA